MNSRQRILAALNHEPVDRVPIDFGGTRQSGISVFAYRRLCAHLRVAEATPPRVFDVYQLLADIDARVLERFKSDTVALNRRCVAFGIPNDTWKQAHLRDLAVEVPRGFAPEPDGEDLVLRRGNEIIARMPANGFYFDRFEKYPGALHPDLSTWRAPRLSEADLAHYGRESQRLHAETDKAIIVAMGPPYELFNGIGQGGFEEWMITFASEPDYVAQLYRELVDAWIDNLVALHRAVGERVQVLQIADDFGTQAAPFLSEAMFREQLLPAYKRGLDWVHNHTSWKVLLHSDGAIRPLIPAIIEMGVDALNPIQTACPGMDLASLRAEFGDRMVFWGAACDAQQTLASGTPDQVRAEVSRNLHGLEPLKGGSVIAPVHNIQADVPPENIVALFDAALTYKPEEVHA